MPPRHNHPRPPALFPLGQRRHASPSQARWPARLEAVGVLPPVLPGGAARAGRCGMGTSRRGGPASRAPMCTWGAGGAALAPGAPSRRGRGALRPWPWARWGVLPAVGVCGGVRRPQSGQPSVPGSRARPRGATGLLLRCPSPCAPRALQGHRAWRHPAPRVGHAEVAAVGREEARAPASGTSTPTKACRRRLPASARASLPLPAAPDALR